MRPDGHIIVSPDSEYTVLLCADPITLLRTMITYKALNAGIRIIEQEESYTSKADLIANDRIPTYGVDDKDASFSGKT